MWTVDDGDLEFRPVRTGASDLDGRVQIVDGLRGGERVVVHSQRALRPRSRIDFVQQMPGVSP